MFIFCSGEGTTPDVPSYLIEDEEIDEGQNSDEDSDIVKNDKVETSSKLVENSTRVGNRKTLKQIKEDIQRKRFAEWSIEVHEAEVYSSITEEEEDGGGDNNGDIVYARKARKKALVEEKLFDGSEDNRSVDMAAERARKLIEDPVIQLQLDDDWETEDGPNFELIFRELDKMGHSAEVTNVRTHIEMLQTALSQDLDPSAILPSSLNQDLPGVEVLSDLSAQPMLSDVMDFQVDSNVLQQFTVRIPQDTTLVMDNGSFRMTEIVNTATEDISKTVSDERQEDSGTKDSAQEISVTKNDDKEAQERFVNYFGECNIRTNVMHARKNGEILSLSEICRKYLGINRDTAAVFTSYSNMRASFKRFLSTGLSVTKTEDDENATIFLKTGAFYAKQRGEVNPASNTVSKKSGTKKGNNVSNVRKY